MRNRIILSKLFHHSAHAQSLEQEMITKPSAKPRRNWLLLAALCLGIAGLLAPAPISHAAPPSGGCAEEQTIANDLAKLQAKLSSLKAALNKATGNQKVILALEIKQTQGQIAAKQKQLEACLCKACEPIEKEIKALQQEKNDVAAELQTAATPQKPAIASQVKLILAQIAAKKKALAKCRKDHGCSEDWQATFTGTATLAATNCSHAVGPLNTPPFSFSVAFLYPNFTKVDIVDFATLKLGIVNVSLLDFQGSFDPVKGKLDIDIVLYFDIQNDFAKNSHGMFHLSTSAPGSPLDAAGNITLAGSGQFTDGYLSGCSGTITLKGKLLPHPPLP